MNARQERMGNVFMLFMSFPMRLQRWNYRMSGRSLWRAVNVIFLTSVHNQIAGEICEWDAIFGADVTRSVVQLGNVFSNCEFYLIFNLLQATRLMVELNVWVTWGVLVQFGFFSVPAGTIARELGGLTDRIGCLFLSLRFQDCGNH